MAVSGIEERGIARRFLLQVEGIRELLFTLASQEHLKSADVSALELLLEMAKRVEIDPAARSVIAYTIGSARKGIPAAPADLARVDAALEQIARGAEESLSVAQGLGAPIADEWAATAEGFSAEIRALAGGFEAGVGARQRVRSIAEVERLIFRQPGRFIHLLYQELNPIGRRRGFSYGSVRAYVDELEAQDRVVTVGGPQGVPRYCFPHPNRLKSRNKYYGGPFGTPGILEKDLTDRFDFSEVRGAYPEVILTNSILEIPILLVARGGRLGPMMNRRIKSYGKLFRFREMADHIGLRPRDGVRPHDILVAGKVILDESPERGEVLWSDPQLEDLYPNRPLRLE